MSSAQEVRAKAEAYAKAVENEVELSSRVKSLEQQITDAKDALARMTDARQKAQQDLQQTMGA